MVEVLVALLAHLTVDDVTDMRNMLRSFLNMLKTLTEYVVFSHQQAIDPCFNTAGSCETVGVSALSKVHGKLAANNKLGMFRVCAGITR